MAMYPINSSQVSKLAIHSINSSGVTTLAACSINPSQVPKLAVCSKPPRRGRGRGALHAAGHRGHSGRWPWPASLPLRSIPDRMRHSAGRCAQAGAALRAPPGPSGCPRPGHAGRMERHVPPQPCQRRNGGAAAHGSQGRSNGHQPPADAGDPHGAPAPERPADLPGNPERRSRSGRDVMPGPAPARCPGRGRLDQSAGGAQRLQPRALLRTLTSTTNPILHIAIAASHPGTPGGRPLPPKHASTLDRLEPKWLRSTHTHIFVGFEHARYRRRLGKKKQGMPKATVHWKSIRRNEDGDVGDVGSKR